jgi:hypothetical protein
VVDTFYKKYPGIPKSLYLIFSTLEIYFLAKWNNNPKKLILNKKYLMVESLHLGYTHISQEVYSV